MLASLPKHNQLQKVICNNAKCMQIKVPASCMNFESFGESCSECKVSSSNTRTCNGESRELSYSMFSEKLWLHLPGHCPPSKQAITVVGEVLKWTVDVVKNMVAYAMLCFTVQNETTKKIKK